MKIDQKDQIILTLLEQNSRASIQLLSKATGMPASTVHHRVKKLEREGIIKKYTIELAIAGFEEDDLDLEVQGETLTISGNRSNEASEGLVHQGLASRNFVRKFVISDDVEVKGAALSNGMLYIGMERLIPEHRKPKKISLTTKKKLLG